MAEPRPTPADGLPPSTHAGPSSTASSERQRRRPRRPDRRHPVLPTRTPAHAPVVQLADDEVLLPGLVDTHVHVNEPGRTEWEGFASATRAAAAGGRDDDRRHAAQQHPADGQRRRPWRRSGPSPATRPTSTSGFWGGAVPGNLGDLRPLHDAGVFGFKCFLLALRRRRVPAPATEELAEALTETAALRRAAHRARRGRRRDRLGTRSRRSGVRPASSTRGPKAAEERAIDDGHRRGPAHRRPSPHPAPVRRRRAAARRRGPGRGPARSRVETCPHYLTLEAEQIPDGATQFKCCPPIREHDNRDLLWAGLTTATSTVVSDHSPCTADLKRFDTGDFGEAWGGIAVLQLGLPAIWTEARTRGHDLHRRRPVDGEGPADQVGLSPTVAGSPSAPLPTLSVFAPDEAFTVDRPRCTTRTPCRRTPAAPSPESSARPGCTAHRWIRTPTPRAAARRGQ